MVDKRSDVARSLQRTGGLLSNHEVAQVSCSMPSINSRCCITSVATHTAGYQDLHTHGPDVVVQVLKDRGADPQAGLNTRATASEKTVCRGQHLRGQPLSRPDAVGVMHTAMLGALLPTRLCNQNFSSGGSSSNSCISPQCSRDSYAHQVIALSQRRSRFHWQHGAG